MELITQSNVMFVIGLIGIGFTVFKSIFDPQKKSETNDLLMDQKADFLRSEYDKKFISIDDRLNELAKNNQNHLHTLETKLDALTKLVVDNGKDLVRIETTMNIKLPR